MSDPVFVRSVNRDMSNMSGVFLDRTHVVGAICVRVVNGDTTTSIVVSRGKK